MTRPIPSLPRAKREPMTKREAYYYRVLQHWYRHRSEPPVIADLMAIVAKSGDPTRSKSTIYITLRQLEMKGYVKRDDTGRFEVIA